MIIAVTVITVIFFSLFIFVVIIHIEAKLHIVAGGKGSCIS